MMKKIALKIVAVAVFLLLLTFNVTTIQNSFDASLGGTEAFATANTVDCYSTFEEADCDPDIDCPEIYDCGPCTKVDEVSFWTDPGECEYNPKPGEN